jgi:hypothetical protein
MTKLINNPLIQVLVIFICGGLIIIFTSFISSKVKKPEIIEKVTIKERLISAPDCPQSFEAYGDLVSKGQIVELIKDFNSFSENGKFVKHATVEITRSGKSQIACGYLYINVQIDGKKMDDKYESIYINPRGFGGHILRSKGITFNAKIADTSEVLLPLG